MIRWLLLCAVCALGYCLPVLIGPASGAQFFVTNGGWSLALLVAVLLISSSRTALAIASLECVAIVVNLWCLASYLNGGGPIYGAYTDLVRAIAVAEIAVLIMGAPWNGVRRMVREYRGVDHYRGAAYLRRGLDSEAH